MGGSYFMSKRRFHDLAPVDKIDNGKPYHDALGWALKNTRIRNIALTGPYGSGKSSIIESFLSQTEDDFPDKISYKNFCELKKSVLKISMASFVKHGEADREEMSSAEIEQGILKQLFYKVKSEKIPQSRYRKLKKYNWKLNIIYTIIAFISLYFLFVILAPAQYLNYRQDIIKAFGIQSFGMNWPSMHLIFAEACIMLIISLILYLLMGRFNVSEISMSDKAKLRSCTEEELSVFNLNNS